jgi:hypothetical protein
MKTKLNPPVLGICRLLIFACLLAALAFGDVARAQQCVTPPSGLIAWWAADGDASDFEGAHNGTLNNGTTFATGEVGQAFNFDASQHQYVDVGLISLPVTFTISAWINPSQSVPGVYYEIINSFDGDGWFFDDINGQLHAETETRTGNAATVYATINAVITTGTWQHVLVTYDGNAGPGQKFHFYVNGAAAAAIASNDQCSTPGTSSFTAKIGAEATAPTIDNFDGRIDELQLFDRVLSADEIAAIYNAGSAGQCKPQLAVSTSTAIPNGVGNFTSLFRPSFNGSSVAFFGAGSGGQQGIYFKSPGDPCDVIADLNTAIPNGTGNFVSFTSDSSAPVDPCIGGDNVAFYGAGSGGQRGIYFADITVPPSPIRIADTSTAIPDGTGNFTDFVPPNPIIPPNPIVSGNTAVFFGAGSDGQQGIYAVLDITVPPSPIKIADLNTAIPSGTGNFTGFIPPDPIIPPTPIVSGNTAAFFGAGSGGQQGIYVIIDVLTPTPPPIKIADLNTAIPGGTGNFTEFPGGPALSGYRLAFIGNGASSQQGVYFVDDVSGPTPPPIKIADLFTAIPDGSGNFTGFGAISVSSTDVAFIGNGSGAQTGIYDQTGGQLLKVITVGQNLAGKTVTGLSLNTTGLVGDPIAYQATFDDGSQALYVVDVHSPNPAPTPTPTGAVSRKIHGGAGTFDVNLPLTGPPGIECRSGGATHDYTMVVTFSGSVTVTGNPQAQITLGTGCVGSGGTCTGNVTVSGTAVTIPLTNIGNAQTINVRLNGVNAAATDAPATDFTIPMSLLIGDTNANATVNAADVAQTKARLGQTVGATNFRSDVNANGSINAADTAIIKQNSGTSLPP